MQRMWRKPESPKPRRHKTRCSHSLPRTGKNKRAKHKSEANSKHQHAHRRANGRVAPDTTSTQTSHKKQRVRGPQLHLSTTLLGLVFYTLICSILTYPTTLHKNYPNYTKRLHLPPPPQDVHSPPRSPAATTTQIWNDGHRHKANGHGWRQEKSPSER